MSTESLLTASAVLDHLVAVGAREFFFAPGSRSAPFVYAAATRDGIDLRTHVRLDERSAGFHALGAAKATGRPAVVVTTSGTAVGNLLPAVMEADHAEVALVVLSADRPPELRGTGANQTTRQPGIFGSHVRAHVDVVVESPVGGGSSQTLAQAVQRALGPALEALAQGNDDGPAVTSADGAPAHAAAGPARAPAGPAQSSASPAQSPAEAGAARPPVGPVHINVALREPLQPDRGAGLDDTSATWDSPTTSPSGTPTVGGLRGSAPTGRLREDSPGDRAPGVVTVPRAVDLTPEERATLRAAAPELPRRRTAILAGDGAGPDAAFLAGLLDLPLLAEPSSNARHGRSAVAPYRLLLDSTLGHAIERVLLIGRPTLSRPVGALLAREDVQTAAWQPRTVAWYEPGRRRETVLETLTEVLSFTGAGDPRWLGAWKDLGARAQAALEAELEAHSGRHPGHLPGPVVAHEVWAACQRDGSTLVAGSSNPIRDLDLCAPTGGQGAAFAVLANRGLAGIDGTVGTAAGAALATGVPVRALMGDLTFLHDAGSLLRLQGEAEPDLQVVVLDDRGGGIFGTLEHGALGQDARWADTVERYFGTRPTADLARLCNAYGIGVQVVSDRAQLRATLNQPPAGTSVVLVPAFREGIRGMHARIRESVSLL